MTASHNTAFAEYRRAASVTQEELARLAECSVAYVRLLDGGFTPDPDRSPVYGRVVRVLREKADDVTLR